MSKRNINPIMIPWGDKKLVARDTIANVTREGAEVVVFRTSGRNYAPLSHRFDTIHLAVEAHRDLQKQIQLADEALQASELPDWKCYACGSKHAEEVRFCPTRGEPRADAETPAPPGVPRSWADNVDGWRKFSAELESLSDEDLRIAGLRRASDPTSAIGDEKGARLVVDEDRRLSVYDKGGFRIFRGDVAAMAAALELARRVVKSRYTMQPTNRVTLSVLIEESTVALRDECDYCQGRAECPMMEGYCVADRDDVAREAQGHG